MSNQFQLLGQRRFLPFFLTQFLGAFTDNFYKNALVVLLTFQAARYSSLDAGVLVNLCGGIFILPFFLLSATAGQLADKFEKSRLIRLIKLLEIAIMALATTALICDSLVLMLSVLLLLGVHSTLFGPVKYAILPQHLGEQQLIGGNALVEAGTFVSILIGTIAGGLVMGQGDGGLWVGVVGLTLAVAGYLASRAIPEAPAAAPQLQLNWNPLSETWRNLAQARQQQRAVFQSMLGISWFWFLGALLLAQLPAVARDILGGSETSVTLLLATFSFGIGIGSLLCERMSGPRIEIGLVPFGSIGLSLFALDLWWVSHDALPAALNQPLAAVLAQPHSWRLLVDLLGIGLFGGFYVVPLYALIQSRSAVASRSRTIAANNILNALFMVVSALLGAALLAADAGLASLFLLAAVLNAAVAIYIYRLVPEFLLRFVVWLLITAVYRLRCRDLQRLPDQGAALLVCNHVSFVDALVISAASRRPIRFVMDERIFRLPLLNFLFTTAGCIPIASARDNPQLLEQAYERIAAALTAGELVGIFPEGRISDDGELQPFRGGLMKALARNPVPVIPLALRGLWGSFFSRKGGAAMRRPLRRGLFNRIELVVGEPQQPTAVTPESLQLQVLALRGDWR